MVYLGKKHEERERRRRVVSLEAERAVLELSAERRRAEGRRVEPRRVFPRRRVEPRRLVCLGLGSGDRTRRVSARKHEPSLDSEPACGANLFYATSECEPPFDQHRSQVPCFEKKKNS